MVVIFISFSPETVTVIASVENTYFSRHDAISVQCYDTDIVDFHRAVNV